MTAIRRLMVVEQEESSDSRPYINTGGPLDMLNGAFVPTVDGTWGLSGGLGATTAVIAEANKGKSTLLNSAAVNAMARFPYSDFAMGDTEFSTLNKDRIANMSDLYLDEPEKREKHIEDLKKRISMFDPTHDKMASLDAWFDYLKEMRDEKIKHHKDFTVESELLNPQTGKPYLMLLPTFASVDSWTEAMVRQLNVKNEEFDADTEMKDQRTINMEEGWQKARLMRQLPGICAKANIVVLMSGHLGKKINVGSTPNKKDLQYMGQDETAKAMGNKFIFLMNTIFKIGNTEAVVEKTDRNKSEYPSKEEHVSANELQRLLITQVRSKNSPSGYQGSVISAQRSGILPGLSYYDFMRNTGKYDGLGSPNKMRSPLLGDEDIGRTKIYDKIDDYKTRRAIELTYQLHFVQNYWTLTNLPIDFSIDLQTFAEKLMGSNSIAVDDILNTRGWWTYKGAEGIDRNYLTLPAILQMLDGTYTPKFFNTTGK